MKLAECMIKSYHTVSTSRTWQHRMFHFSIFGFKATFLSGVKCKCFKTNAFNLVMVVAMSCIVQLFAAKCSEVHVFIRGKWQHGVMHLFPSDAPDHKVSHDGEIYSKTHGSYSFRGGCMCVCVYFPFKKNESDTCTEKWGVIMQSGNCCFQLSVFSQEDSCSPYHTENEHSFLSSDLCHRR